MTVIASTIALAAVAILAANSCRLANMLDQLEAERDRRRQRRQTAPPQDMANDKET